MRPNKRREIFSPPILTPFLSLAHTHTHIEKERENDNNEIANFEFHILASLAESFLAVGGSIAAAIEQYAAKITIAVAVILICDGLAI